jgi:Uma2 family endonuclease
MDMAPAKVRLTYDDFILFPDNGKRHELIDGDHIMTPAPSVRHQRIVRKIGNIFNEYLTKTGEGEIFYAPVDVFLSEWDIVEPDLVIIKKDNMSIIHEKYIKGPPDLIIEILSPATKDNDLRLKKHLYEKYGVTEYWIVDPEINNVQQYIVKDGKYIPRGTYTNRITSHVFPSLLIDLSRIF